MTGKNADQFDIVRRWDSERTRKGWWHSFELPDGSRIDGVNELEGQKKRIGKFPIPEDLRGKRVLDIGAWDGWFTFEMERRGAEVMAIDNWDNPRFREAHALMGSRAEYRQMDMYELTPDRIGRFDIVLFMGVLYHLKHPLLALELVCALTTGMAAVDSFVLREKHRPGENVESRPLMEFYETDEFGGQTDNWVGATIPCLLAFCRTAGFARAELCGTTDHSACVACYREWNPPKGKGPGPELIEALHNPNLGINFHTRLDDYVEAVFVYAGKKLTLDDVRPEVSGFGTRPIILKRLEEDRWQANFKLPPGLTPGWHDVRMRIGDGPAGNARRIAVDVPFEPGPIEIRGISDNKTWVPHQIDLSKGDSLAIWVAGLPENADRNNVRVYIDGVRLAVTWLEGPKEQPRQLNAAIPDTMGKGKRWAGVAAGERQSQAVEIEIV